MSTLTPTGTRRRGPLPIILAVVLALAIGVAGGWWFTGRDKSSAAPEPSSSSSCSTSHASASKKSGSPKPVVLPDPRTIKVNVYNATKHRGLARATSVELAARGFGIGTVANDPLNKLIVGTAEIRYGSKGAAQARVVAAQVPTAILVSDKRTTATVDFVIGERFTSLNTPAQAGVALTASPSPTASAPC